MASGSGWGRTRSGSTFEEWRASKRQSARGRRSEYREELPF